MADMRPTRVRHIVLWITVVAYMITYMDRVVIASAIPKIQEEFGIDDVAVGLILGAFRLSYALFQIPGGWLGDRIGPRRALAIIVTWWSLFTSFTALAWNAASMVVVRFLFGMGEAGAFPIATRSLSRWMLPSERGYAQGITHAGSRLGQAMTPPIVVALIAVGGWRMPFVLFGVLGIAWSVWWYVYYRDTPEEHKSVNEAELKMIHAASPGRRAKGGSVPWGSILRSSTVWTLAAMYFFYGWCFVIYQDWFPKYLYSHYGVSLKAMGFLASLPLLAGLVGDLAGGWLSDRISEATGNLKMARRSVAIAGFLIAGAAILPAAYAETPAVMVAYSCLALFGLELTVGISWAVPLDIGGDYAGSVSAVMNTCGNSGGTLSTTLYPAIASRFTARGPFLFSAVACVLAAVLFARIDATRKIEGPAQGAAPPA
jgi:sugar phosphate permease